MLAFTSTAFTRLIRVFARSILLQRGPMTGSDLVRAMGLDPRNHKGTVHAVLVQMESQVILSATKNPKTGKRHLWFTLGTGIRKRDRIAAAILG